MNELDKHIFFRKNLKVFLAIWAIISSKSWNQKFVWTKLIQDINANVFPWQQHWIIGPYVPFGLAVRKLFRKEVIKYQRSLRIKLRKQSNEEFHICNLGDEYLNLWW